MFVATHVLTLLSKTQISDARQELMSNKSLTWLATALASLFPRTIHFLGLVFISQVPSSTQALYFSSQR